VAKVDSKGNGQLNKESMVVELTIDFLLSRTIENLMVDKR
jgi:hypothetical protein